MLKFSKQQGSLNIKYKSDFGSNEWVRDELKKNGKVTISSAFIFSSNDLVKKPPASNDKIDYFEYEFCLGVLQDSYYKIEGRKLGAENDILINEEMTFERKLFVAERNISIFPKIDDLLEQNVTIIVGGNHDEAIPKKVFAKLQKNFPTTHELNRYAAARVANVLSDYLDGIKDAGSAYEQYLNRKMSSKAKSALNLDTLHEQEINKYTFIRDFIEDALNNKRHLSEKEWQELMTPFLLLIFPKYVRVLQNVCIHDFYSKPDKTTKRYIDLALIDANGNLDIIEIKKPFENTLLRKSLYRDNSVPTLQLSGSVMQAEKYIFHLQKWGIKGENTLTQKHENKLPNGMNIRISNPKGIIIVGRDRIDGDKMSNNQLLDFEVIKRKYANMLDIITYDDLLRRLNNTIVSLNL